MSSQSISPDELRDAVRAVLKGEGDLGVARLQGRQRDQALDALWQRVADLGCLGLGIAERYAGLGLGFRELGILYEELGRHLSPLPVLATLLAAEVIVLCGDEPQRKRWLPDFAGGSIRACLGLPLGRQPVPRLEDAHTVVGSLGDVLDADRAQELLVPVRDERGLFVAMLSRSEEGLEVIPRAAFDTTRTLCEIRLHHATVGPARLFRLEKAAWCRLIDHASVALARDSVGGAARILEDTVGYLGTRRQFDRPLGSFQALKHRAASWKVLLEGARALGRHAAELMDDDEPERSAIASCAKVSGCDTYVGIAGDAIQLHGGIGFTWEHECHLFLKRARLNAALFGSSVQHKERAAQLVFAEALAARDSENWTLFAPQVPALGDTPLCRSERRGPRRPE